MKHIVSISIGSSKRDHHTEIELLGEKFIIERIGTDGSLSKAVSLVKKLDGKVDAFGMGGIDLYLWAGKRRYTIKDACKLRDAAKKTPIVDGSGLKNTLERNVIGYLKENSIIDFTKCSILVPSAMDRFGMAEAIEEAGGKLIIGDLIFSIGINIPIYSLEALRKVAFFIAPIACSLPIKMLYPIGGKQNHSVINKKSKYYDMVQVIAGDFHYIKQHMPSSLWGKTIITNTVTEDDILELKARGVQLLVTTTPNLGGRSYGTNVIEALLLVLLKATNRVGDLNQYEKILKELNLQPRIENLNLQRKIINQ
ncbi:quinate 5-dehydrogenase [Alkaliphilus pronyensis]|uniref:Quinate 5-dehydrogenase n=1 Tax=Alkaliphilus pronyensis TaxID=1482732 RepID=A0A6I0F3E6_9FIRM|nr:quinate 5-dehydrogenase [Alkaliphilus pronyensis]KAB3533278.1 quinate 5-dehydrogenase [Alkaliphilus pronyensis]